MNKSELAWLGGLLEGEGSFLKGPPSKPNQPRISVEMTDRDVIQRVARLFDVSYVREAKEPRNPKWKRTFSVSIKGRNAVALMRRLRPLMGNRRQGQIDVAIASFTERAPGDNSRKLTAADVRRIRASTEKSESIGPKFGVSGFTIRKIRRGESWRRSTS